MHRGFVVRHMIERVRAEPVQAVIGSAVHAHHARARLDQFNRRQKPLALQAAGIEFVRRQIGSGDQRDAALKQLVQKSRQNHRVGDVADGKFIQTQRARLFGEIRGDKRERVAAVLQLAARVVHRLHKAVVVNALRHAFGQRSVKHVHQRGLAGADSAPQIQAARAPPAREQAAAD